MVNKAWFCGLIVMLFLAGLARGQELGCLPDQLASMSWCELENIYRKLKTPGRPPKGYLKGEVIYPQQQLSSGLREGVTNFVWRGKHFCDGSMINQFIRQRRVRAEVYVGESWLDGEPSLIMDYQHTSSRWWRDVRDEMREVCPGVYLCIMYLRRSPEPRKKLFFVLRNDCAGHRSSE